MKKINVIGDTYGQLKVVNEAPSRLMNGRSVRYFNVVCTCGNTSEVYLGALRAGKSTSCGCFRKEATGNMSRSHGMVGTRLYRTWKSMRNRCNNANNSVFEYYGGRGISVCEEWATFETFQAWALKAGYSDDLTIDRIDNSGN